MEMTIDGAIHEIESELHHQRYDCSTAQLSTGLRDAMKTAVDTMGKYQKIAEIVTNNELEWGNASVRANAFLEVKKVVEDGND